MEPKFQSSFIPKNPVVSSPGSSSVVPVHTSGIFSVIAGVIFTLTLVAAAGVYFYQGVLNNEIAADNTSLASARASFEPATIQQLIDANARIAATKNLLDDHVTLSDLLVLLQQLAVKNIRFGNFVYTVNNGTPTVSIDLNSIGYNALAEQESIFGQNSFITNQVFSNFNLGMNGAVTMNFFADINPSLVSYKNSIVAPAAPVATTTAAAEPVGTSTPANTSNI